MRTHGSYSAASYAHGRPNSDQGYRNEGRSRDRRLIRHRRNRRAAADCQKYGASQANRTCVSATSTSMGCRSRNSVMGDNMTEVSISTPHHQLKGYLAKPQGEGPWPAVIVLHDIFGLTDVTRGHADWLAREGYLAVALDLFSWGGRIRCIRALMTDLSARKGASFGDVDAGRQWLGGREDCTGKVGVIGFCATGGFAILLAASHGFSAVAPNYGRVPNDIDAIMIGACPVVASFGGRDWPLKGAAARLQGALERNK